MDDVFSWLPCPLLFLCTLIRCIFIKKVCSPHVIPPPQADCAVNPHIITIATLTGHVIKAYGPNYTVSAPGCVVGGASEGLQTHSATLHVSPPRVAVVMCMWSAKCRGGFWELSHPHPSSPPFAHLSRVLERTNCTEIHGKHCSLVIMRL